MADELSWCIPSPDFQLRTSDCPNLNKSLLISFLIPYQVSSIKYRVSSIPPIAIGASIKYPASNNMDYKNQLLSKIAANTEVVGIIGLGYVGLLLAVNLDNTNSNL